MTGTRSAAMAGLLLCAAVLGVGAVPALAKRKRQPPPPVPLNGREAVTLTVRTVPNTVVAKVMWGRKLLGETPLIVQFPRDMGPVDVVVEAPGYLPVYTRMYTVADDRLYVRLTSVQDKKNLFGYRREPVPDGGAPPPPLPPPPVGNPDGGTAPR